MAIDEIKKSLLINWDVWFGGGTGFFSSILVVWAQIGEHVLEACLTTLFVTLVGVISAHYCKKSLPILDKYIKKLIDQDDEKV